MLLGPQKKYWWAITNYSSYFQQVSHNFLTIFFSYWFPFALSSGLQYQWCPQSRWPWPQLYLDNCSHFSLRYTKNLLLIAVLPSFSPNFKAKHIYPFSLLRLTSLPIPLNIYPPNHLNLLLVSSTFTLSLLHWNPISPLIWTQLQPVLKNQHITLLLPSLGAYFLKVACIASSPTITSTLKSSSGLPKSCSLRTSPPSPAFLLLGFHSADYPDLPLLCCAESSPNSHCLRIHQRQSPSF